MKKIFLFIFLLSSCVDKLHKIAVVKNQSNKNITVVFEPIDSISDKTLFYGSKYKVNAKSSREIYDLGYHFEKIHFFIFNDDSVYNNINKGKVKGIVEKSFLKKVTVSSDSLKKNDTIVYKGY